ncbi:MAG: carbon starvation protein A, partial [Desulfobacterales bacterium]|nr:carbon starvation protein A [Desulfobacterales bacterium]
MNSLVLALGAAILYLIAYHTYGKYLGRKIFKLNPDAVCPSEELQDDKDFVPTKKPILFGHHFTSIAGTGPIVGPAIAIIWGWVPALIWILIGSIFMGAVHDFGAMVVSLRNQGRSIGDVASDIINKRVRTLFLIIIFFELWIVV